MMKLFFVFLIITVNAQQRFAPIGRAENPPTQVNASNLESQAGQRNIFQSGTEQILAPFGIQTNTFESERECEDCRFCSQRICCRDRDCTDCRGQNCCVLRKCNFEECGRFEEPIVNQSGQKKCIPRQGSCTNTPLFTNENCFVSPCFLFEQRCRNAQVCIPDPCRPCTPRFFDNLWNEVCR